jgi:DNA-binding MarR family transcriptional regulator
MVALATIPAGGKMSAAKSRSRSVGCPEDHLGYWLTSLSSKVVNSLARRFEKFDVSVSEWVVMRKLFDQPSKISISDLAEQMGMTKAPVSRLVERLVQKEFVDRQADRNDGRAQQIWLSRDGQKMVPKLAALADENDEAFFGHLNANARVAMVELMQNIVRQHRRIQGPMD